MKFTIPANAAAKPFKKHWKFCVGSGHAALAMRTDYCEQLKQIHDDLGIERVRFHGIFSDDMHTYDTMATVMPMPGAEQMPFYESSFRLPGLVYAVRASSSRAYRSAFRQPLPALKLTPW